jgi:hypothetical protein
VQDEDGYWNVREGPFWTALGPETGEELAIGRRHRLCDLAARILLDNEDVQTFVCLPVLQEERL